MRIRYGREELEGLRDANVEAPLDAYLPSPSKYDISFAQDVDPSKNRNKKRKRKRSRKNKCRAEASDDDEDGDFGGMFDEGDVFNGVFLGGEEDMHQDTNAWEEYDSDEYDDGPAQKVAFVVEGEPDFDKEEPDDGWEYIRRVKWEAAQCPGTVVAEIRPEIFVDRQTNYMPTFPTIPACDRELLPAKDWESRFLNSFAELRSKFEKRQALRELPFPIPSLKDDSAWKAVCFGNSDYGCSVESFPDMEEFGAGPMDFYKGELNILLNLDEVSRANLLRKHVSWLKELDYLPHERAMWLFALTAAVDKPVDAETSFALRTLLRSCASIRASRRFENGRELQLLNMIITVAGKFFGQDDSQCM